MEPQTMKSFSDTLCLGAALVGIGSAMGLWLPLAPALGVLAGAVCRVSWIGDSRRDDLATAGEGAQDDTAIRHMRAQGWSAFAWALAAGIALGGGAPITWGAGAVALAFALRQADGRAVAAARRASGAALPRRLVAGSGASATPLPRPRRHD
jgi:hypothetical protein